MLGQMMHSPLLVSSILRKRQSFPVFRYRH